MRYNVLWMALLGLYGCQNAEPPHADLPPERWEHKYKNVGKLFGGDVVLWGSEKKPQIHPALWYGALQTLKMFPLKIIDAQGGVLQTDWCVLKDFSKDRFQLRVTILPSVGIQIQSVRVDVIHQVQKNNQWEVVAAAPELGNALKHDILLNARTHMASGRKMITPHDGQ